MIWSFETGRTISHHHHSLYNNTANMMQQPLREIKPKNARTKRFLENKAPQIHENPRTALFLKYSSTSEILNLAMTDLHSLKRPLGIKFSKKNVIHPFEDPSSLEFFSEKNDASMMVFGSHSKKRPHCMTVVRMFDWKVLDMLELMIEPETMRTLSQFKNEKARVGLKPLISFSGSAFESPTENAYTLAKSLFLDLFKGPDVEKLDVEGLQYIMNFSVEEEEDENVKPVIRMRCYLIRTKKAGGSLPKVEVEEMGPRIDFRVGRTKEADTEMLKDAMRKPKGLEVSFKIHNRHSTIRTNRFTGKDKEEHRNRHHWRQDRPYPHWQAGSQPASDQEDEGSQAQPRRARRRGCFRWCGRPAQRRRQEGSHRLGGTGRWLYMSLFVSFGLAFSAWRWWAMCKRIKCIVASELSMAWHLSDQDHILGRHLNQKRFCNLKLSIVPCLHVLFTI
jgi:ribosome production factor 2